MAGAARFLDRLPGARRAEVEPLLMAKIAEGVTLDPLLAWCQEQEIAVGRSTLNNFMREVRAGGSAEDPGRVQARKLREAMGRPAPPAPEEAPPAAAPPPEEDEEDADHGAALRRQIREAGRLAREAVGNPKDQLAARKLQADLQEQLRAYERQQTSEGTGPRVVFFFPERTELRHLEAEEA